MLVKTSLRVLSLVLALLAVILWSAMGANRGWTRTSVPMKTVDEVTGIEAIEYRKQFVPGIELLGGALAMAGLLGGISFLFKHNNRTHITE